MFRAACLALVMIGASLCAQERPAPKRETPPPLQAAVDRLIDKLKADDLDGMFTEFRKQAIITNPEALTLLELHVKSSRPKVAQNFGQRVDVELVGRYPVGDSLMRFVYLEKFELGVFVWSFTAYRARQEWRFLGINFTSDVDSVFRTGNQR